jgi:hypothetical protein
MMSTFLPFLALLGEVRSLLFKSSWLRVVVGGEAGVALSSDDELLLLLSLMVIAAVEDLSRERGVMSWLVSGLDVFDFVCSRLERRCLACSVRLFKIIKNIIRLFNKKFNQSQIKTRKL